jgi:endonuclease YncB( thermonuclease family)
VVHSPCWIVTYKEKDWYGRILGKVSTDSIQDANLELIKSGMIWHYSYYDSEKEYAEAEKQARKNRTLG